MPESGRQPVEIYFETNSQHNRYLNSLTDDVAIAVIRKR